jgi:hypothetical protein
MKLRILATAALLATAWFAMPVKAQNTETVQPVTPSAQAQPSGDQVLQASSQDRVDSLPNPFKDVPPNHWAFKAVMSIYYCGAYTGVLPLERVRLYLQQPQAPASKQQHSKLWVTETLSRTPLSGGISEG